MTNLFKQTTIYALLFTGLLFNACVKDISDQFDKPDKPDSGGSEEVSNGIPDDFDWSTTSAVNLTVKVVDRYEGKFYYTIEVYDENPFWVDSATLLAGGKTNSQKFFEREIVLSKTIETVYILQTDPYKRQSLYAFEVSGKNMMCDLGALIDTKSAASTYADGDADRVDYSYKDKKLDVIEGNSFAVKGGGKYIINDKFKGQFKDSDNNNTTIYVKGKWVINQKTVNFNNNCNLYVLEGGKIELDEDVPNCTLHFNNASLIAVEAGGEIDGDIEIVLNGKERFVNEGEVEIDGLSMPSQSTLINFCVFEVDKKINAQAGGSSIVLKPYSMIECDEMVLNNITVRMDVGSIFKAEKSSFISGNKFIGPTVSSTAFALLNAGIVNAQWGGAEITNCIEACVKNKVEKDNLKCISPAYITKNEPNVEIDDDDCNRFSGNHNPGEGEGDTDDNYHEEASATPAYTYMFEDNWPSFGDYDMNDLVMDVSIANSIAGANATSVTITTTVRAVGATKALYAFARIEAPGAGNKVVQLFDGEAHAFMGGSTKEIINTHTYKYPAATNSVTVELPSTMQGVVNANNLNVFLVWGDITGNKWNEIHLPGFGGTDKAAQASSSNSYKYKSDGSQEGSEAYSNMMWALRIPAKEFKSYPREGISIKEAYSGFEDWAKTGGSSNYDWYTNPSDDSKLFQPE